MMSFKDSIVKNVYYKIKDGSVNDSAIVGATEMYLKRKITDIQKEFILSVAHKIRRNEMSFEEYWALYKKKIAPYEKNV